MIHPLYRHSKRKENVPFSNHHAIEFSLPLSLPKELSRSRVSAVVRDFFCLLPEDCTAQILYQHDPTSPERRYVLSLNSKQGSCQVGVEHQDALRIVNYFVESGMAARIIRQEKVNELTEIQGKQRTIRLETEIDTSDCNITELLRHTLQEEQYVYILTYKRGHGFDLINSGALGTYGLSIILTDAEAGTIAAAQDALFEMGGGVTSVVRRTKNSTQKSFKPLFQGDSYLVADLLPA